MIVKFDHISYVDLRKNKRLILEEKGAPVFREELLYNLDIKKSLMRIPQDNHDLYFYEEGYPTEYLFYDEVKKQSQIQLIDDTIYGHYFDKERAIDFLKGIFGNKVIENEGIITCNMKGILDKRDYILILEKCSEVIDSRLDDGGYGGGGIALVSSSRFAVEPVDGLCTSAEELKVNGKNLEICFTKSASTDVIFEIIRIKGK